MTPATGGLAVDAGALDAVKRAARDDPRQGLRAAAQQFEAVFLQMVLKAMRDTVPEGGPFDSNDTRLYRSLLDQQLAQTLSAGSTTGLAALIEKQLGRALPVERADLAPAAPPLQPPPAPTQSRRPERPQASGTVPPGESQSVADAEPLEAAAQARGASREVRDFVARLWPNAHETSRATGIPAHFLVAHAALETGWGRGEIRHADGRPSHNLFNIKAGASWQGATVEVATTEYVGGVARRQVERFRAYGSYAEAFADYAALLKSRYAGVIGSREAADFARGLQQAGYATDPMYADKLTRIIGGATLRASLSG